MKRVILILPLILFVTGCFKEIQNDPLVPIVFPAGQHRPLGLQSIRTFLKPDKIEVSVLFDSSSIYRLSNENQGDWNKLTGLAFAPEQKVIPVPDVHQESARLAWRWIGGKLEIGRYTYVRGVREYGTIDVIPLGEMRRYRIGIDRLDHAYVFGVWDAETRSFRTLYRQVFFHKANSAALCQPYFGGNETPTVPVRFWMRDLIIN